MSRSQTDTIGRRVTRQAAVLDLRFPTAGRVVAAFAIGYLPVLVAASGHAAAGWAVALGAAILLVALARVFDAESLACALVPASALTLSGLVQPASEYMAFAAIGLALVARCALDRRAASIGLFTVAAPRVVVALLAAYVAWAAVATAFSTDRRTSIVYLAGIALALSIAFWAMPFAIGSAGALRRLLVTVVVVALAAVAVTAVLGIAGPGWLFGAPFGSVLMIEPTILGGPTHLVYPRVFGPYIDQGPYYTLVAVGLIAACAVRSLTTGPARALATGSAVLLAIALLACFSRAGWAMAIAGGLVWTVASVLSRRPDRFAGAITSGFVLALVALLLNVLGANGRFDVQFARGWPAYLISGQLVSGEALLVHGPQEQIRGGLSLTERDGIWAASIAATRHRPLTGYGPGTDAAAIAPDLGPRYAVYRGISSHSAWLRTSVEMGVPALLLLLAIWGAVLGSALTALRRQPRLIGSATAMALLALAIAFLADQTFEVYLLGGLDLPNLLTATSLSLVAAVRGYAPGD